MELIFLSNVHIKLTLNLKDIVAWIRAGNFSLEFENNLFNKFNNEQVS